MIGNNLRYLRKKNNYSQQHLSDTLKVPRTTLGDYERGKTEPNIAMLIRFSKFYETSLDALINLDLSKESSDVILADNLKVLAISVDQNNNGNIELVDTKAEAGYLESFQDPQYIKELPKIQFPNIPKGTYRGFEINGDSMLPIESGSIVICSYVESLAEIKDDRTYVIISKSDGLVYKRVRKDASDNSLVLISDNDVYLPYKIDYHEISEVWQYYAHLSFSDQKQEWNDTSLHTKINHIQKTVESISKHLNS